MKNLAERLTWARTQAKMTQAELAKSTGVAQSTIASWESGARESGRKITVVANFLCVSPLWLSEGTGEPYLGSDSPENLVNLVMPAALPVALTDDNSVDYYQIPMVQLKLQAGMTGIQTEPMPLDGGTLSVRKSWADKSGLNPARLVATKVKGESMEPSLYEDDIIVINTADTKLVDNAVYAINYEGEAIVKRISRDAGEWWLTSDNFDQRKYHRKLCRSGECIIVGKVVLKESSRI